MSKKVNAMGFRLGVTGKWKSQWFIVDRNSFSNLIFVDFEIQKYIKGVLLNRVTPYFVGNIIIVKNSFNHIYILIFYYKFYAKKKYQRRRFNIKRFLYIKKFLNKKRRFNKIKKRIKFRFKFLSRKLWLYKKLPNFFIKKNVVIVKKNQKKIINKIKTTKLFSLFNPDFSNKNINFYLENDTTFNFKIKEKEVNFPILKNKAKFLNIEENYVISKNVKKQRKPRKALTIFKIKQSLQCFTNSKISIVFIDLLKYIKFYTFYRKIPKLNYKQNVILKNKLVLPKNSFKQFIFKIERRNRRHVTLIRDVLNILYISFCLKQPQMLVRFLGYQLMKTSRKKKHTKLLKVLWSGMRVLMSIHKDVLGFKIKMKGRINGKRRARFEIKRYGTLPLQKQTANISYGSSYGITKYGSLGIKIWIYYSMFGVGSLINEKQQLIFLRFFAYNHYNKMYYLGIYNKKEKKIQYENFYNIIKHKKFNKNLLLSKSLLKTELNINAKA